MSCKIVLQNFGGSVYPGATVSGHVDCTFGSNKNIRGVKVKVRGKEHNSWTETESYNEDGQSKTRTVTYTGDNTFLRLDTILVGESSMKAGHYEYPFTFTLPRNLPMNFKGNYGYINYYIKAIVDLPFASDYEDIRYFNVNSPIDFNLIRSELQLAPISYQDEKTVCCCCCASGPIELNVLLQKEAFVVGETIRMKINVMNLSNRNVESINSRLKSTITSEVTFPNTKHKADTELLASTSDTGVGAHGEKNFQIDLDIPKAAAVYNFNGCSLFKQSFSLKIEACLPDFHSNLDVKTSVKLGHIPLGSSKSLTYLLPQVVTTGPYPQTLYANNQPPTYSASGGQTSPGSSELRPPSFGHIGFSLPPGYEPPGFVNRSSGMLVPVHGGPLASPASCSSASAPSKGEIAGEEGFVMVNGEDNSTELEELPPPSYGDAVRTLMNQPGLHSSPFYPAGSSGPSAPSLPQ